MLIYYNGNDDSLNKGKDDEKAGNCFFLLVVCLHDVSFSQTKRNATDCLRANRKCDVEIIRELLNDFTKAINLKPDYADAYYGRGSVKYLLPIMRVGRDYTKAIIKKRMQYVL